MIGNESALTVWLARHGENECSARRLLCGAGCDVAAFNRIHHRHRDGRVFVIFHETILRALRRRLLAVDLDHYRRRFAMPDAAVSIICVSDARGVQLIVHGITGDRWVSAEH